MVDAGGRRLGSLLVTMDAAGGANRSACRPAPGGGYNSSCVAVNDTDSQWVGSSIDEIVDHFLNSLFTYREPRTIILTVLYTLLFILALVGNLVVIAVIMCNQSMRSVTNYFLFNLAVADLLGKTRLPTSIMAAHSLHASQS